MKMRLHLFGIWCLIMLHPGFGWGDAPYDPRELIQKLPHGYINWSQGILVVNDVVGAGTLTDADPASETRIREQITRNMFENLGNICVDAHSSLLDVIRTNDDIQDKLVRMALTAPILTYNDVPDGTVEKAIRMELYGGFSQLMLPSDIKQVESIKSVNKGVETAVPHNKTSSSEEVYEDVYTGLIVDARDIGVQPALVPVLVDENNCEVYGAAFVSREFAVQQGMCGYARTMRDTDNRRVGQRPLLIKGLRRSSRGPCDIVISNSDAAKLRSASAHLAFLKQCRVVILSD